MKLKFEFFCFSIEIIIRGIDRRWLAEKLFSYSLTGMCQLGGGGHFIKKKERKKNGTPRWKGEEERNGT